MEITHFKMCIFMSLKINLDLSINSIVELQLDRSVLCICLFSVFFFFAEI